MPFNVTSNCTLLLQLKVGIGVAGARDQEMRVSVESTDRPPLEQDRATISWNGRQIALLASLFGILV